jgi:2-polyprenyl-6-methoxyphenol hydroxylase-like FAD-dependent oxidoreductase
MKYGRCNNAFESFLFPSRPPFLGQGANQAIISAHMLARLLSNQLSDSIIPLEIRLRWLVTEYEWRRRPIILWLTIKAIVLGRIEVLGGPIGIAFRTAFFRLMSTLGVIDRSFLSSIQTPLE